MNSPCDNCGLCCSKLIIEIEHIDVVREPKLLPIVEQMDVMEDSPWDRQYLLACGSGMPCKMLGEDKKCQIYPTRPNTCIGFEVGCDKCNELREDYGLPPIELKES